METVLQYLKDNPIFYVATMDGDQPRVRPFGVAVSCDGKLYFCTGDKKQVYRQMGINAKVEMATTAQDHSWLRLTGEAVFDGNDAAKALMLQEYPQLEMLFGAETGPITVFYLKNAVATFYIPCKEPQVVEF